MKKELRFIMKIYGYEHLAMSNEELQIYRAKKLLKIPLRNYLAKLRFKKLQIRMATKLQAHFRGYLERKYSFVKAFKLDENPTFYIIKEQLRLFT